MNDKTRYQALRVTLGNLGRGPPDGHPIPMTPPQIDVMRSALRDAERLNEEVTVANKTITDLRGQIKGLQLAISSLRFTVKAEHVTVEKKIYMEDDDE